MQQFKLPVIIWQHTPPPFWLKKVTPRFVGKVEPYFLSAGEVVYYYKTTMSGFQWSPEMLAKALFAKTKNRA